MKQFLFLVLLSLLNVSSCYEQQVPANRDVSGSKGTAVSSGSPILEVITTAYGAAYPKEGDILQMRLLKADDLNMMTSLMLILRGLHPETLL
jgi:hypothetical protein